MSKIEWTDQTWNPVTGCTKVSSGCDNCYADLLARRLQKMGNPRYENAFNLTLHHDKLTDPYNWKKPRRIFVNSMSDLFHKDVPDSFIKRLFRTMVENPQHQYQILTKRPGRIVRIAGDLPWPECVWMGVSVENSSVRFRIDKLRKVPAKVRFLSLEPLLGPLPNLNLEGIDWVIVGGESGPGARPMEPEWVEDIQLQCRAEGVPFFFKQWGHSSNNPDKHDPTDKRIKGTTKGGRSLNGVVYDEYPA